MDNNKTTTTDTKIKELEELFLRAEKLQKLKNYSVNPLDAAIGSAIPDLNSKDFLDIKVVSPELVAKIKDTLQENKDNLDSFNTYLNISFSLLSKIVDFLT